MTRYVLAIDQSTSATKAMLFSEEGQLAGRSSLEHKQHYPGPGKIEHDPQEIYQNTVSAISAPTLKARASRSERAARARPASRLQGSRSS